MAHHCHDEHHEHGGHDHGEHDHSDDITPALRTSNLHPFSQLFPLYFLTAFHRHLPVKQPLLLPIPRPDAAFIIAS